MRCSPLRRINHPLPADQRKCRRVGGGVAVCIAARGESKVNIWVVWQTLLWSRRTTHYRQSPLCRQNIEHRLDLARQIVDKATRIDHRFLATSFPLHNDWMNKCLQHDAIRRPSICHVDVSKRPNFLSNFFIACGPIILVFQKEIVKFRRGHPQQGCQIEVGTKNLWFSTSISEIPIPNTEVFQNTDTGKTSLNWGNTMYLTWKNSHLLQIRRYHLLLDTKTDTNPIPDPNRYRRRCPDPNATIQKFIHYMTTTYCPN